jgi:hypothetical protein
MANRAGALVLYDVYPDGKLSARGGVDSGLPFLQSKYSRSRLTETLTLQNGPPLTYLKRARDLGSSPAVFTEWETTDPESIPPTLPPVGPWGEIKIVGEYYPTKWR